MYLHNFISHYYLQPIILKQLHSQFRSAQPFPHLELQNFFNQQKVRLIEKALKTEPFEFKPADLFQFSQTKDLLSTKNKVLKEFRVFLISQEFLSFMEKITGLKLKRGTIDIAGTLYQDTDFLLCHDDQLEGRKIAYFLYLSTLKDDAGGKLQLYHSRDGKPNKVFKTITPQFNTFSFFEVSPASFHSVGEVTTKTQRLALSGWFHG